jgi:hypothetical protein
MMIDRTISFQNTYRSEVVKEILPSDGDEFNTVEQFVNNFMPMAMSNIILPKRVNFVNPLIEEVGSS